ncbi:MAG TPA: TetR/AcrR family transcriptional regulator [Candidatus Obscuribacterales bacterium]
MASGSTSADHGLSGKTKRFHQLSNDESKRFKEKREQILEGALRAFLGQGYAASMDTIAQEAGVAKQTLYSYYKDKKSLLSALIDRLLDRFVTAGMSPEILTMDPQPFLRKIAQITLSRMDDWEYVSLLRLIIAESAKFPELGELYVTKLIRPGIQKLATYISANEKLSFADPEATARIIHGSLIHFIVVQEILYGKHSMPLARERMINALVDMVLFASEKGKESR